MRRHASSLAVVGLLIIGAVATAGAESDFIDASITVKSGPSKPSSIPVLPCPGTGRSMFFGDISTPPWPGDYEPIEGSYGKHSGDGTTQ